MKDFKLYTKFNFAKLLSVPEGNLCSSPEGIIGFIKPYLRDTFEDSIVNKFGSLYTVSIDFNF